MSQELVAKGRVCIQTAKDAYNAIAAASNAVATPTLQKLEALQENGKHLIESAKQAKDGLEKEEDSLQQKMAGLQQEKQQLLTIVDQLRQSKTKVEEELKQHETKVRQLEQDLVQAQQEVQNAEGALNSAHHHVRRKKKKGGWLGGIGGAALGFVVAGPVGAVVGAGAGATAGGAISADAAQRRVDQARSTLSRRTAEKDAAMRNVESTKQKLPSILQEIAGYEAKINQNQVISDQKHKEIGVVKKSVAFVMESIEFWEIFLLAAQHATSRTERLKSIVQKAEKTVNLSILKTDGTITVARSFVDAWEALATQGKIQWV